MTNKIQLTVGQDKALKQFKENGWGLNSFLQLKSNSHGIYVNIKDIQIDDFARLLYEPDSYEVSNPIQTGSFVRSSKSGNLYKVYRVNQKVANLQGVVCQPGKNFTHSLRLDELELVTPEEIKLEQEKQMWGKMGRKVGEFREGDRVVTFMNNEYTIVDNDVKETSSTIGVEKAEKWLSEGTLIGLYPIESFVSLKND